MNINLAKEICSTLHLGAIMRELQSVQGGFIHKMWAFETDKGKFAVKVLNEEIICKEGMLESFEHSENIARKYKEKGIPAISGMVFEGKAVQDISGIHCIVYPWLEGKTLPISASSLSQAFLIGEVICKIHQENLNEPQLESSIFQIFSNEHWRDCIIKYQNIAGKNNPDVSTITQWNMNAEDILSKLQSKLVVSHGDIDQKNVIWKDEQDPSIIDWEGVSKINPELEIVDAALNWGGLVSGEVDQGCIKSVIDGYKSKGGYFTLDISDILNGCRLKWLAWLEFNLRRACSYPKKSSEHQLAVMQIDGTLRTLYYISQNFDDLVLLFQDK